MHERLACIHQRGADGSLTPLVGFELPPEPEIDMGGGGLYATVGGYWATQILPFIDGVSYPGYLEFETSVYRSIAAKGELARA